MGGEESALLKTGIPKECYRTGLCRDRLRTRIVNAPIYPMGVIRTKNPFFGSNDNYAGQLHCNLCGQCAIVGPTSSSRLSKDGDGLHLFLLNILQRQRCFMGH